MTWIDLFVRIAAVIGAGFMVSAGLMAVCALWWHALGRLRKCAYETYLLADLHLWMRRHSHPTPTEAADRER